MSERESCKGKEFRHFISPKMLKNFPVLPRVMWYAWSHKPQMESTCRPRPKSNNKSMSDRMLLQLKIADCSAETADIFDSRKNSSWLMTLMLKFRVQLQIAHQLKSSQNHQQLQHRTAQENQHLCAVSKEAKDYQLSGQFHRPLSVRRTVQLLVADAPFVLLST